MRLPRRLLAVPFALAVAGSLAACGSSPSTSSSSSSTPHAAAATAAQTPDVAAAKPAAFVLTAENFSDLGTGIAADPSYSMSATIGVADQSIAMNGVLNGKDLQISETVPGLSSPIDIRYVDGAAYVNLGDATNGLFWQLDLTDTSNPLSAALSQATGQASIADSIASVQPAIVSVTPSGAPEDLDGVSTQPYEVVVDTTKITGAAADQFATAKAQGVTVPDTITYTYWIGTDKLPRKMTMDLLGSTTEMLFTNWGSRTPVEAPTPDQITTTAPAGL